MRKTSAGIADGLCVIVLAAGGSSRLGRPKQLLRRQGVSLIVRAVTMAGAGSRHVVVVLGADRLRIQRALDRHRTGVIVAHNAAWADGLAGSLRAGLRRLPKRTPAVLILLVDQVRLRRTDIARLVQRWRRRPHRPAAACLHGVAGVPAIIPRRWFRAMERLEGDTGARALLRSLDDVSLVEMPAAAFDIDTPADLEYLSN